jgi:hypothetical protein
MMPKAAKNRQESFSTSYVAALAAIELENVFNPYLHICTEHDDLRSPEIRQQNLRLFLTSALEAEAETVWIGRDLGYRGGRRTGLPLTDEGHLVAFCEAFEVTAVKATRTDDVKERTATEIWRVIRLIEQPPFLWNAFPFHPHEADEPLNNRCHTKKEFAVCEELLAALLDAFAFTRIFVLGNDAARAMERLGRTYTYVRHPSYGGQTEFRRQMAEAYDLELAQ